MWDGSEGWSEIFRIFWGDFESPKIYPAYPPGCVLLFLDDWNSAKEARKWYSKLTTGEPSLEPVPTFASEHAPSQKVRQSS